MSNLLEGELWIRKVPSQYTHTELSQYLTSINLTVPNAQVNGVNSFDILERLVKHHLMAFPFENTSLH